MTSPLRTMMLSKVHRATVTRADLHYVGSLTLDSDLMAASDLLPGQQVDVLDVTNGNRLTTYVIAGKAGSGEVCINGAAAHLVEVGDLVIVVAYGQLDDEAARSHRPRVVFVDEHNRIVERCEDPGWVPDGSGLQTSAEPIDEQRRILGLAGQ